MLKLLRVLGRILTGSTYAVLGFDAASDPGDRVTQAEPVLRTVRAVVPLPEDDALLVRANGSVQVLAGASLAAGKFPRLSALTLFGSLVPTTLAGHAFWTVEDPTTRKIQRVQFTKNMALLGGLVFAVIAEKK